MAQAFTILLAVLVFGIALPWLKGLAFLNPVLILGYSCIGVLFIAPVSAQFGAEHPPRRLLLSRMAVMVAYGWGLSVGLLLSALVTVNLAAWHGRVLSPPVRTLVSALLLGLAVCFVIIAAGTTLGMVLGANAANRVLRTGLLVLVLVLAFGPPFFPSDWRALAAGLMLLGVGITAWALTQTRVRVE